MMNFTFESFVYNDFDYDNAADTHSCIWLRGENMDIGGGKITFSDIDRLKELNEVLANMGMNIKGINNKVHPKAIADVVTEAEKTGDKKKQVVVSSLVLRSLKLAKYNEKLAMLEESIAKIANR